MQRLITLKFVNSKCNNFNFLMCMGGLLQITSDQIDESIWKLLAIEYRLPDIGFKT